MYSSAAGDGNRGKLPVSPCRPSHSWWPWWWWGRWWWPWWWWWAGGRLREDELEAGWWLQQTKAVIIAIDLVIYSLSWNGLENKDDDHNESASVDDDDDNDNKDMYWWQQTKIFSRPSFVSFPLQTFWSNTLWSANESSFGQMSPICNNNLLVPDCPNIAGLITKILKIRKHSKTMDNFWTCSCDLTSVCAKSAPGRPSRI